MINIKMINLHLQRFQVYIPELKSSKSYFVPHLVGEPGNDRGDQTGIGRTLLCRLGNKSLPLKINNNSINMFSTKHTVNGKLNVLFNPNIQLKRYG